MTGLIIDEAVTKTGVIVVVYSLTDDHDVHYFSQTISQIIDVNVTALSGTEYGVSVFTLENGIPFPRVAAFPTVLYVVGNKFQGLCLYHYYICHINLVYVDII